MITTDEELAVVRQQAARVEEIILDLGRDIRLGAGQTWPMYVERWVEMLRKLRREVDEYLGIADIVIDDRLGDAADEPAPDVAPFNSVEAGEPIPA